MFGAAPFVVPPRWHTEILDWRDRQMRKRRFTRRGLADFDIEIRELYFDITAELLDPTPPRLCNTDGDPLALTTLTYELNTTVDDAFEKLAPLAIVHGEDHSDEIVRNESGAMTSAVVSWVKAGNRRHKQWDNTVLGTIRIEAGRLVVDVNSARRSDRVQREIGRRLGHTATLISTAVVDSAEVMETQLEAGEGAEESGLHQTAELLAIQEEMTRQHWEGWLDTRVPALGHKTPRQAARTIGGRERLEALLAGFERDATDSATNAAGYLTAIRAELGLLKPPRR